MYFVFSDVHGCYQEMKELLKHWNPEKEKLVFLGDMVDRGNDSFSVVKHLMDLKAKHGDNVMILKGNHEDMFCDWLSTPVYQRSMFYYNGLHETLKSFYFERPDKFKKDSRKQKGCYVLKNFPDMIRFMKTRPTYYETSNLIFVHAGYDLTNEQWRHDEDSHLWIRNEFIQSDNVSPKRVFFGHTPVVLLNKDETNSDFWLSPHGDKVGIDGGCCFGHELKGFKVSEDGDILKTINIEYGLTKALSY